MEEAIEILALVLGQIISDSVPLLYFMFAFFLIGLTMMFFMGSIRKALKRVFKA